MSYPDKQIGWSIEAKLLQEVIKKLDYILKGKIKVELVNSVENPVNTNQV